MATEVSAVFDLDRLEFAAIRDAYPDRYEKVSLAAAQIVDDDGPRYVVKRPESDDAHICELVTSLAHAWGTCGCEGYKFNDGPCSHLCAVWRAEQNDLVEIPSATPTAISVEIHDDQTELAQHSAEPEQRPVADGGERQ